jgi:hypothetical protein
MSLYVPLQGSPGTLRTLFVVHMSSLYIVHTLLYVICMWLSFVHHCMSLYIVHCLLFIVCCLLFVVHHSFVICMLSYIVIHHLFIICMLLYVVCMPVIFVHRHMLFICYPSYVIHHLLSFVCCPCGNEPRNRVENSLLVTDKKDKRYKKLALGPNDDRSRLGPLSCPLTRVVVVAVVAGEGGRWGGREAGRQDVDSCGGGGE